MNSYFQQKMLLAIEKGNTTEINSCLKELTNIQNEMARISNEFDKSKARTFLLNKITQLQEFGKTVYKYKEFINHGMIEEFKNEFENINSLIANGALDEITYQWQTEPNACKTCRDLNGKEFYNAKDVPNKPHPNCKCKIVIITLGTYIKFETNLNNYNSVILEIQEDIKELIEKLNRYMNNLNLQNKEIGSLFNVLKNIPETDDRIIHLTIMLTNHNKEIMNAKIELEKITMQINEIKNELKHCNNPEIYKYEYQKLKNLAKGKFMYILELNSFYAFNIKFAIKNIADTYGFIHSIILYDMPEAYSLYCVASPNKDYNEAYVQKNGYLFKNINDINIPELENDIRKRIKNEMKLDDCKVLVLKTNSSLAQKIAQSNTLKKFLKDNIHYLKQYKNIPYTKITFENDDHDLYAAIHGGIFKDAHLDKQDNLYIRVEDFYNFEVRFTSDKAIIGRYLQDTKQLIPYYLIVNLKISKENWEKLL